MLDYKDIREILSKDVTEKEHLQNICMKVQYFKKRNYSVGETLLKVIESDCEDFQMRNHMRSARGELWKV